MNQLIGMLISTLSVSFVMLETFNISQNDSDFIHETFTQIKNLHDIRDFNHKQYAKVTHSKSEDFRSPYHLTSEEIEQLEISLLNVFSYDTNNH
jgi:hypothetical protein